MNEIYQAYDSASVLYALIYKPSNGYIWDTTGTPAFEAVGTWNDARVGDCDIPLTAAGSSDMHFADFPAGITVAGNYIVQIRVQAGASPDTDDMIISQGFMVWDGTAEVLPSDITADIAAVATTLELVLTAQAQVRNDVDENQQTITKVLKLDNL